MERMTDSARPKGMESYRRIRGLAAAGLLSAALAGCGSAVQSTPPAKTGTASGTGGAAAQAVATLKVGCAAVNQATSVTVERHAAEQVNSGVRTVTQRNEKLVRALFHDFCAVLTTTGLPHPGFDCISGLGGTYTGTFYDGQRTLATFTYSQRGCPQLHLTGAGQKTRATFVLGKAAAAAPHLNTDLAAVLGS